MRPRNKKRLFKLLTVAIVLLALEGGARLLEAFSDKLPGPYELHYGERPGFELGTEVQSYDRVVAVNAGGYIGTYYPPERAPDTFRIVLLGDSMSFGFGVDYEQSWAYRLEQGLNRVASRRIELLNFSVPGFNTYMEYESYRQLAVRYRPDHVLVGYYPNDAAVGERHLPNIWRNCPLDLPGWWQAAGVAAEYSGLVRVIHDLVCLWRFGQPGNLTAHQLVIDPEFPGFRCSMFWLGQLQRELDRDGIGMAVIQIPFLDRRDAPGGDPEARAQEYLARLLEWKGFHGINLYPGTVGRDVMSMRLPDTHPNAAGHRMLAELLLERRHELGLPADLLRH